MPIAIGERHGRQRRTIQDVLCGTSDVRTGSDFRIMRRRRAIEVSREETLFADIRTCQLSTNYAMNACGGSRSQPRFQ